MLFVLHEDLLPFSSANGGPELEGLQNLLLCIRQGAHAISGAHEVFLRLSKNPNLAARERATALRLANRRTELPLLEKQISYKIVVTSALDVSPKQASAREWHVLAKDLSSKFLSKLTLLAENVIDAELYQRAAAHYKIKSKIKGIKLKSSPRGGGGSQIDVELRQLLLQGIPVMAITDGDLTYPGKGCSVISGRCDTAISAANGIGWHTAIPVREIENIIPHSILSEVSDPQLGPNAAADHKNLLAAGLEVENSPCRFTCFKQGKLLEEVFSNKNTSEQSYWLAIAKKIRHERVRAFSDCLDDGSCSRSPCTCVINRGYGNGVLAQVKAWLDERSLHESFRGFSESDVWMGVGAIVFELSIAFEAETI